MQKQTLNSLWSIYNASARATHDEYEEDGRFEEEGSPPAVDAANHEDERGINGDDPNE